MAKNLKGSPASAFLNIQKSDPPAAPPATSEPKVQSEVVTPTTISTPVQNTDANNNETTFSMNLPKKNKKTKLTSLQVNADEYEEFSKIVRDMGYKKSEIINQFISDFVKANRK